VPRPALLASAPEFYGELAKEFAIPYEGGIVKDVLYSAGMKSDAIHPNAQGYQRMAEAIAAVARHTGARAAVGHSFGGAALGIALARGLRLDAAAVVGAPASPFGFFDGFCEAFAIPGAARAALQRRLEERVGVPMASLDARALLSALEVPGLVVHDALDREIPLEDGETIARAWPGARLLRTEGLGHRRILRDPGVGTAIAGFLAERLTRCGCGRLAVREAAGEPRCLSCLLSLHLADRRGRTIAAAA